MSEATNQETTNQTITKEPIQEVPNPKELSYSKEKELFLRKEKINKIVYEIKYNRNYESALQLINEFNINFEEIINSTVKLTLEDLIILIEKSIKNR